MSDSTPTKPKKPTIYSKFHPSNIFLMQLLAHNRFFCPNYELLNDPYDCRLILDMTFIRSIFEKNEGWTHPVTGRRIYHFDEKRLFDSLLSKINTKTHQVGLNEDTINARMEVIDHYYNDFVNIFLKTLNHNVVSFTINEHESENDLLMWAHYTYASRGVKLTFDFGDTFGELNVLRYMEEVFYDGVREVKAYNDIHESLFHKGPAWSYEKEYRMVRTDENWIPFEKWHLTEMTFGYNMPESERHAIIKIARGLNYLKCKFFKMVFVKGRLKRAPIIIRPGDGKIMETVI